MNSLNYKSIKSSEEGTTNEEDHSIYVYVLN